MAYISKSGINIQTMWDDIRFPLTAARLEVSSGRLEYNFFNGAVGFQSNARYPNEPASMLCQVQHDWKLESSLKPHLHWIQQSADEPNWLLAYKILENGDSLTIETDYSNHTLAIKSSNRFTYSSGNLLQFTEFPTISMLGITSVSAVIHFALFRDSNNTSTLFADVDPSSITEYTFEFDIHYERDALGSRQEFSK